MGEYAPERAKRSTVCSKLRGRRLAIILREEVMLMPIALTFHAFGITITLKLTKKSNNRHSAK